MLYIARNVIQTVYHNVVQCLQKVKHNVVQAIVDSDTLNLERSVIQCRTNHSYAKNVVHYIVHNSLQPVIYSVAQNVSKIQKCAVFRKLLQTVVANAALNVHTMLKKSQKCREQCWKQYSTNCFSLCWTKKGYNVVSCTMASSA